MTPTLRSFSAALLLLVVVALLGSASVRAETACSCGGRANTATGTAHCASGYSTRSAVVRGYVAAIKEQNESVRYTITVREVLFNNANAPLAFGNSMYVFASSNPAACGTFLNYHTEYFLRAIHITDVDFSMNNCDYREITSSAKTTTNSLACGRSLGECDRYPCEASRPCSLSPTRITCTNNNGAPCPQRVCGTSVCTGVVCPPITCPNPVVVGCCRQCGNGAIVSASAVFVLVLTLVSLALSMQTTAAAAAAAMFVDGTTPSQ